MKVVRVWETPSFEEAANQAIALVEAGEEVLFMRLVTDSMGDIELRRKLHDLGVKQLITTARHADDPIETHLAKHEEFQRQFAKHMAVRATHLAKSPEAAPQPVKSTKRRMTKKERKEFLDAFYGEDRYEV